MLIEDATLEVTALLESVRILQHCRSFLTPGSGLHVNLCQIELRLLYLLRHRHLSPWREQLILDQERSLRRFLGQEPQADRPLPLNQ